MTPSKRTRPRRKSLRVERPATGGGVGRAADGRVIFVRHSLPGELVRVAITETTSSFYRGDAVEVLEASPERVTRPVRTPTRGAAADAIYKTRRAPRSCRGRPSLVQEHLRRIAGVERESR